MKSARPNGSLGGGCMDTSDDASNVLIYNLSIEGASNSNTASLFKVAPATNAIVIFSFWPTRRAIFCTCVFKLSVSPTAMPRIAPTNSELTASSVHSVCASRIATQAAQYMYFVVCALSVCVLRKVDKKNFSKKSRSFF